MMAGMMTEMPFEHIEEETKNSHVCDNYWLARVLPG
jgi:hypothetical protein